MVDVRWASDNYSPCGGLKLRDSEADCRGQSFSCDTGEGDSLHQQKLQQAASTSTDDQHQQQQQQGVALDGSESIQDWSTPINQEVRKVRLPPERQPTQQAKEGGGSSNARPPGRPPDTRDPPLQQQPQRRSLEQQPVHTSSGIVEGVVSPAPGCAQEAAVATPGDVTLVHQRGQPQQPEQHPPQQLTSAQWTERFMQWQEHFLDVLKSQGRHGGVELDRDTDIMARVKINKEMRRVAHSDSYAAESIQMRCMMLRRKFSSVAGKCYQYSALRIASVSMAAAAAVREALSAAAIRAAPSVSAADSIV